jgi:rhodanese-related sulfurtransferase
MTPELTPLPPAQVAERLRAGHAVLIDIREPDEFARLHIQGAISRPLSAFEAAHLKIKPSTDVVFACRSGLRTQTNCGRLASALGRDAFILEGGVDAWKAAGLPVAENRKAPLEMMRQVQIGAGGLVLIGALLGFALHPAFHGLSAIVGAGLVFAGASGFCGMARLLALAPWNQAARA